MTDVLNSAGGRKLDNFIFRHDFDVPSGYTGCQEQINLICCCAALGQI